MRSNRPVVHPPVLTHEGARAERINPEQQLLRSVMSCMLFEDTFYEDGQSIADRIHENVVALAARNPQRVMEIAIAARELANLRHVPLWIVREMARQEPTKPYVRGTLSRVIQRADELAEFLALYWKDGKQPLSAQVKKGLADAFQKFDAYALAKYDRANAIRLRDVLFLTHAKPRDEKQAALWKQLVDGTLESADTWEVSLSAKDGVDKKTKWTRLIEEKKLGGLATLRNLRNMQEAGVEHQLIRQAILQADYKRVLPFRFIAAARYAPLFEDALEAAMLRSLSTFDPLPGRTALLIDVSGSMSGMVSGKSEISRLDAACGVAMLAREICEHAAIITFSNQAVIVPARRGFALRDAIVRSQPHGGTDTYRGKQEADRMGYDRLILITDEQSHPPAGGTYAQQISYGFYGSQKVLTPPIEGAKAYCVNVAPYKNGIGYGNGWTHIDGWSESVIRYIQAVETGSIFGAPSEDE